MSSKNKNEKTVSEPIDVEGSTVSSSASSEKAAPAAATESSALALPEASQDGLEVAYGNKVDTLYGRLEEIADANPEFAENLSEVMAYLVARVEGMAGNQQVPIPYVNVRQGMTKEASLPSENIKQGELYTSSDRIGPELRFIPLYMHHKRVKFNQSGDRPDCSSNDAVTGFKYGNCATCPHAQRDEAANIRAACSFGYAFAVVDTEFTQLYYVDFMKTSSGTGKKLRGLSAKPTGIFSRSFRLYTTKEKNEKGEYYVLAVAPTGDKVTGPQYDAARILSAFFEARHGYTVARQLEGGDKGGSLNAAAGASGGAAHTEADGDAAPDFSGAGL